MKNAIIISVAILLNFAFLGCSPKQVKQTVSTNEVSTMVVTKANAKGGVQLVDYKGEDTSKIVPNKPYPQNVPFEGITRPNHKTINVMNDEVSLFYDRWKADYLKNYPGTGVLYIEGDLTGDVPESWPKDIQGISTSEATGYGLMIFALMAGHDPMAKSYFDGLLELYLNNQSMMKDESHAPMMSWVIPNKFDQSLERVDGAADGDLDIAYACLLANAQWGSNVGEDKSIVKTLKIEEDGKLLFGAKNTDYLGLAKRHMKGILKYLVAKDTNYILMGDWATDLDGGIGKGAEDRFNNSSTRPSDWMLDHLKIFSKALPDERWDAAIKAIYGMFPTVQDQKTGLFPDFVENVDGVARKVVLDVPYKNEKGKDSLMYLESEYDDAYNWNACRVPWRLATDAIHYGSKESKAALEKLDAWSTKNIGTGPSDWAGQIWHGYTLDGNKIGPDDDWSVALAFTAPMVTALTVDPAYQSYLNSGWDFVVSNFEGDNKDEGYSGYFSDSIALLNMLLITGNWWAPSI
ncbi:MAG: hypothetical protein JXR91_01420 [Deltaproteobacteria bacterium]|nr:hypothetical protein [Deltaproteobacteria bacterium]